MINIVLIVHVCYLKSLYFYKMENKSVVLYIKIVDDGYILIDLNFSTDFSFIWHFLHCQTFLFITYSNYLKKSRYNHIPVQNLWTGIKRFKTGSVIDELYAKYYHSSGIMSLGLLLIKHYRPYKYV